MHVFTTPQAVANHLGLATPDQACRDTSDAVNAFLADRDDLLDEHGTPTAAAKLGAVMLGARLHRRRNSPFGVESFDGTTASITARTDPDISRLLRIDWHSNPGVG